MGLRHTGRQTRWHNKHEHTHTLSRTDRHTDTHTQTHTGSLLDVLVGAGGREGEADVGALLELGGGGLVTGLDELVRGAVVGDSSARGRLLVNVLLLMW